MRSWPGSGWVCNQERPSELTSLISFPDDAKSMQRQIGVPSALVVVVEGVTMLLVLAAMVKRT